MCGNMHSSIRDNGLEIRFKENGRCNSFLFRLLLLCHLLNVQYSCSSNVLKSLKYVLKVFCVVLYSQKDAQ